jgi:hypothetical protein
MAQYKWDFYMATQRAHIVLPEDLIAEIDSAVGPRGRSAFLVETARAELRRRKLLAFLRSDRPAWQSQDHPELAAGTAAWVKRIRSESEARTASVRSRKKRIR